MGNLYEMKKGAAATLYHCSEYYVGEGEDKAIVGKTHGVINIPEAVREVIEPIFSYKGSWSIFVI